MFHRISKGEGGSPRGWWGESGFLRISCHVGKESHGDLFRGRNPQNPLMPLQIPNGLALGLKEVRTLVQDSAGLA